MSQRSIAGARSLICWRRALVVGVGMGACAASAACDPGVFSHKPNAGSAEKAGASGQQDPAGAPPASQVHPNAGVRAASGSGGKAAPQAGKSASAAGKSASAAGKSGTGGGKAPSDAGIQLDSSVPPVDPCPHASDPHAVTVAYAEAGAIEVPNWVSERVGAAAARVGDKAFEIFGAQDGLDMAVWGRREGLLATPPHYDDGTSFVPLFDADATPTDFTANVTGALEDNGGALVFFSASKGFYSFGTGIARVPADAVRAKVLRTASTLVPASDIDAGAGPAPWEPPFTTGALLVSEGAINFVYLYGCGANPSVADEGSGKAHESPCRLARVPRAELQRGERFRYWDGQAWKANVARAAVVIDHVSGTFSVSYNRYLGRYLALSSRLTSRLALLSAEQPQGPWEALSEVSTLPSNGGFGTSFAAIELPALRSSCDDVLYISYVRTPRLADGGTSYVTQLARIELH